MNGYKLSYVALSSANPAGVAEVLEKDLGSKSRISVSPIKLNLLSNNKTLSKF